MSISPDSLSQPLGGRQDRLALQPHFRGKRRNSARVRSRASAAAASLNGGYPAPDAGDRRGVPLARKTGGKGDDGMTRRYRLATLQRAAGIGTTSQYPPPLCRVAPYSALSITTCDQAPTGFLVITGSEPPDSNVFTVRSKSAGSSLPFEPAVSLLISPIIRR